ncbi:MAG: hypothetical protein ACREMO_06435 [Gemmatimonadales bacterium]
MARRDTEATALGSIALLADKPVKLNSPKLQSTVPGTDNDPVYLALTYCFDLMRRMEYIFKATESFALQGDPELARAIEVDNETLNAADLTWKQRAERAQGIMIRLYEEVGDRHDALLRRVAYGGGTQS